MNIQDSDSGYTAIDLDSPTAQTSLDFEIVDQTAPANTDGMAGDIDVVDEEQPAAPAPKPARPAPAAKTNGDDDDDDGDAEAEETGAADVKRKLTRAQRLKNARDMAAARAAAAEAKAKELEEKLAKYAKDAEEGAAISLDLVIQTIEDKIKGLRRDYDAAFDSGDRDKLWEVQRQLSALETQKEAAARERRDYPRRGSGGEAQPQTQQTTAPSTSQPPATSGTPSPRAVRWSKANADWWNVDKRMTRRALVIDAELIEDGYDPNDDDYWEALDTELAKQFPDRFQVAKPAKPPMDPTIQNRGAVPATGEKIRVVVTADDRRMANQLGMSIQDYAKEKLKYERSRGTATQYTEI